MKHSIWITLTLSALFSTQLLAGLVYEIEVTDHEQSPPATSTSEISIEEPRLKMLVAPSESNEAGGDMIWRGDLREMVVIDHDERSYMVMDEETIKSMASQVGQASVQIAEALKNVPEDQRAMIEKMMKDRMPQQAPILPVTEIRKTSESAEKAGYPCVKYSVFVDGREARRLWVTEWDNLEGGEQVAEVFLEMSGFFSEMMESVKQAGSLMGGGNAGSSAFEQLSELGGFPVVSEELADDGSLESRSELRSTREQTFDPAAFEPPSGYKRRSMM